jgi:hypothetical protein
MQQVSMAQVEVVVQAASSLEERDRIDANH